MNSSVEGALSASAAPAASNGSLSISYIDVVLAFLFLAVTLSVLRSWTLHKISRDSKRSNASGSRPVAIDAGTAKGGAFILPSYIHHARMMPKESVHAFQYPTLYLAVPLAGLESGECNLGPGGRIFRWNGVRPRWALSALRPNDYLGAEKQTSWLAKLEAELVKRQILEHGQLLDPSRFEVWAVSMPSLLGIHGINPLTVYYIYHKAADSRGDLWLCLLEVHNTFSESHLYVLPVKSGQDREADDVAQSPLPYGDGLSWRVEHRRKGYSYQWTFPRSFHVSPFNDRGGYYRLCLKSLWSSDSPSPVMDVRLLLLVPSEDQDPLEATQPVLHKKLLATLSSHATASSKRPLPLTSRNLLLCLSRQPLDLLLTFVRIAWEAAKLHYRKRLNVYGKPDMTVMGRLERVAGSSAHENVDATFDGVGWPVSFNPTENERLSKKGSVDSTTVEGEAPIPKGAGALRWAETTGMDSAAYSHFAAIASRSPKISVKLIFSNGQIQFLPSRAEGASKADTLEIYLLSPAFFSDVLLYLDASASSGLLLLMGSIVGRRWGVNDVALFHRFFVEGQKALQSEPNHKQRTRKEVWLRQRFATVRQGHYQWAHRTAASDWDASLGSFPSLSDFLVSVCPGSDVPVSQDPLLPDVSFSLLWSLWLLHLTPLLMRKIFRLVGARYVSGEEPWGEWERGVRVWKLAEEKKEKGKREKDMAVDP